LIFKSSRDKLAPTGRGDLYSAINHPQYPAKIPQGDCGIGGTGVTCPI